MTFLLPAALAALVLVGLPVVIHLLRREETREESFPALRYILPDARIRQRRLRLREQILLALRVAAVLAAVLAAARWVLPTGSGHLPPADVVVVIENGIVSGAVVDGRRILDAQRELAAELLNRLGAPDRVWIMPTAPADLPVFPLTPAEALVALGAVEPAPAMPFGAGAGPPGTPHSDAVERAVRRAHTLLSARNAPLRQIVVVRSDGGRVPDEAALREPVIDFGAAPPADVQDVPVFEVDPGLNLPENRGIVSIEVNGGLDPRAGDPVSVDVTVRATPPGGPSVAAGVPVRIFLEEEMVAAGRTDPDGRVRLTLQPLQTGSFSGWVEIDPDALRLDDRVPLVLEVLPPPTIRIVGNPGRWTRLALATLDEGGRIRLEAGPLPAGALRSRTESLPPLPAGSALVVAGDLIVAIPPTDPSLAARFNAYLDALWPPGARQRPVQGGRQRVRLADPSAPGSFQEVSDAIGLPRAIAGTEVHRWYQLMAEESLEEGGSILARLMDGTPWIIEIGPGTESSSGPSTLRVLGSPLDPAWSDLPISAAMVPALEWLLLPGAVTPGTDGSPETGAAPLPPSPVLSEGPPPSGWARTVLSGRRGREAAPFLAWLLFVILCTEGWLAAGSRAGKRPDHEMSTPP